MADDQKPDETERPDPDSDAGASSAPSRDGELVSARDSGEQPAASEGRAGGADGHAKDPHAGHAGDAHAGHGMSHLTPVSLLVGVFAALIVFTIVTVLVTRVDLGGEGNFVIAMIIATIKASLVMAYFMHLRWDKRLNLIVFLSSFLFVTLFLGLALTDRKEYQDVIDSFEETQALQAGG